MNKELSIVGKNQNRVDAMAKALGLAKYTADFKRSDMLIGKALYAKYPHALIKKIDTSKAEQLDGVVVVMTAKDLPGRNGYGILCADKPVIAEKKVKYEGDPVALVAAVNEETARKALELIDVEYEVLPAYDDPRDAIKEEAIPIHENHPAAEKGNLLTVVKLNRGDVDKAFEEADIVIENDYETPMVEHCYLEPDVCIAEPDSITGGLTLISAQQAVYSTRRCLAPVFGLPQSKVRAVCTVIGGGFGGKEDSVLDVASAAGVLALKAKKTVYFELSREEIFRTTGKRHAAFTNHKLAATKDGKIIGIKVETILDKGAYVSMGGSRDPFHGVTMRNAAYSGGCYAIPNAKVTTSSVFTNHPYSCAFRGFGVPQAIYAMECQIDELAKRLGMDPVVIRQKNMLKDGDRTIFGQVMKESRGLGLGECIDKVKERIEWDKPSDRGHGIKKRGRGFAVFMYGTGVPLPFEGASCYVNLQTDGTVNVYISNTEMGQGLATVMSQIASETLGIRLADILVTCSDTAMSPDGGPTVASRSTVIVGNAVMDGCKKLRNRILEFASKLLGEDVRDIGINEGKVFVIGKPETAIPIATIAYKAYNSQISMAAVGSWYPPKPSFHDDDGQGNPAHAYAFGAHAMEIEVDTETGHITILKSIFACDVGKAINPVAVEGQMEGGAAQGIGWAIMEQIFMNGGIMENAAFHNYLIPTTKDLPDFESIIVEHPNELGPFGAKGIGEPPIIPAAPAIRNALYDALGFKINTIPLTPERILEAINNHKNS